MKKLYIVTTGGTIEKIYDENTGQLKNHKSNLKERVLTKLRYPNLDINILNVMDKDSLDLTQQDRNIICFAIKNLLEKESESLQGIVVLHGTDTVDKTADLMAKELNLKSNLKIPIVFTGAMRPLVFQDTDGMQNIIESIYATNLALPGIYLSFHGVLFTAGKFVKNHKEKTFEWKN